MKIQPLDLRVLVELESTEVKTAGGIIIPETVNERNKMAEVRGKLIAMGENAFSEMNEKPKIGDRVMIAKYSGVELKKDNPDDPSMRICNDEDIVAILS